MTIKEDKKETKMKAKRVIVELSDKGLISAVTEVGRYYYYGNEVVERNVNKAVQLLTEASKKCAPTGMFNSQWRSNV